MKNIIVLILSALALTIFPYYSADAHHRVYVKKAPPKHKHIVKAKIVKPFPNAVFIAGHWHWNGHKYLWKKAKYVKARKGYVYKSGYWKHTRYGWRWIEGRWIKKKPIRRCRY